MQLGLGLIIVHIDMMMRLRISVDVRPGKFAGWYLVREQDVNFLVRAALDLGQAKVRPQEDDEGC